MNHDRRHFVAATAALAATQVVGAGVAGAQARRDGRTAVTRAESEASDARMASGRFTCVRTPEADEGPFYYQSSLLRRALAENRRGLPLKLRIAVAGAAIPGKLCPALCRVSRPL